jgi:AcrR family transcriptional regulator
LSASERRAREKAQRRQEIIDAARAVFFKHGFRRPTMEDVAAQAEISKGTIYLYFESKEAVLAHLLLEGLDELLAQMEAAYQPEPPNAERTPEQVLHAVADAYLQYCVSHPNDFRLQMAFDRGRFEEAIPHELYQEVLDKSLHGLDLVVEAIKRGQKAGVFVAGDPRKMAGVCWAALNGVLVLMGHPMRRQIVGAGAQAMFEATLDMLIKSLRAAPALIREQA